LVLRIGDEVLAVGIAHRELSQRRAKPDPVAESLGVAAFRSTGATLLIPSRLSILARARLELDQFEDAWRCIREAMAAIETMMRI
jgi:hypothetical protein